MHRHCRTVALLLLPALGVGGCSSSSGPDIGSLKITVATDGADPDPDGYTILVQGRSGEPVAVNGEVTLTGLTSGSYVTRLTDLADNCFVAGPNPVTIEVRDGAQATAAFSVSCPVLGARVRVATVATGHDLDPDGYLLKLGASAPTRIASQGTTIVTAAEQGPLPIELSDVAANCTPDPTNPATVTAVPNLETPLTLRFTCTDITGSVKITIVTSGTDMQTGGFAVTIDSKPVTLGAGNTATIGSIDAGVHSVTLAPASLRSNCLLSGPGTKSVTIAVGVTAELTFAVTCTAFPGIMLKVTTTGTDIDADGYVVILTDMDDYYGQHRPDTVRVTANGTVRAPAMPPASYFASMVGLAANCAPIGITPNPVALNGSDVTLTISVRCDAARQMAFVTGAGALTEINVASENGTPLPVTHNVVADSNPAWSPDGRELAFASARDGNSEIYVMNADGSNVRRLTTSAAPDYQPSWSSDGTRIAFVSERDGNPEIYVMSASGSNPLRLTTSDGIDAEPAWSPAGNRILFVSTRAQALPATYVMNADGSAVTSLRTGDNRESNPVWSPTGTQVAFVRMDNPPYGSLRIMNVDGSDVHDRQLYNIGPSIAWAPDGRILFTQPEECGYYSCTGMRMRLLRGDGSTGELPWANASEPAWRP